MGGLVAAKARTSEEVWWHFRRREDEDPEVSTGSGAIADSPSGEHRFYPGGSGEPSKALEPRRPVGLLGLPGVGRCELQAGIMEASVGAMRGRNSAAGISLPLLTQWKACLVTGFLFCGCPWWGARAVSSSSEKLRELSGTRPDLPLAPSVLSWTKELYLGSLTPVSQGLQLGPEDFKSLWAVPWGWDWR